MTEEFSLQLKRRTGRTVRVQLRLTEEEAEFWRYVANQREGDFALTKLVLDALEEWRVRNRPDIPLSPKVKMQRAIRAGMELEHQRSAQRLIRNGIRNAKKFLTQDLKSDEPMETKHTVIEADIAVLEYWQNQLESKKAETPTPRSVKLMLDEEKKEKNGRYARGVEWR